MLTRKFIKMHMWTGKARRISAATGTAESRETKDTQGINNTAPTLNQALSGVI